MPRQSSKPPDGDKSTFDDPSLAHPQVICAEPRRVPLEDRPPREQIEKFAQWVADTCLAFGCEPSTAYKIAGALAEGLEEGIPFDSVHVWHKKRSS